MLKKQKENTFLFSEDFDLHILFFKKMYRIFIKNIKCSYLTCPTSVAPSCDEFIPCLNMIRREAPTRHHFNYQDFFIQDFIDDSGKY